MHHKRKATQYYYSRPSTRILIRNVDDVVRKGKTLREDGEGMEEEGEGEDSQIESEDYYDEDGMESSKHDDYYYDYDAFSRRFNSVIISDPNVFNCCVCSQILTVPVYECANGHAACSTCAADHLKQCRLCLLPIGYKRCITIERVLESIHIPCLNVKYGCKETLSLTESNNHDQKCIYVPCLCPYSDCHFTAPSKDLFLHFINKHRDSIITFSYDDYFSVSLRRNDETVVLREEYDNKLFVLNNYVESLGSVVSISCFGNSFQPGYDYSVGATYKGRSLILHSITNNIQSNTVNAPSSGFFVVPFNYFDSSGSLKLEIRIRDK
ncbi:E3 ubiquitin-protein ligase SINA-like 10 [Abrus precatorius]|uniref:E3 ubiquitin-protein ligase SINA-like 10 n=1 Tax=Abrus precatorius TaxID=3816 RepID=A0A8B8K3B3_ABRPR|nr:E3 ubiquitin-protein ligase SINA-like 10 [Abrus precatorius]